MADMLVGALAAACDATLSEGERDQWARVASCILGELPATETTTATALSAATKCLDTPTVVRVLVSAIWCVHGDGPKVAAWTAKLVDRARAEGHVRTVVTLVDLLLRPEVMVYEPFWTLIPSNKAILPILWHMFPEHPACCMRSSRSRRT